MAPLVRDLARPPFHHGIVDLPWNDYLAAPGINPSSLVHGLNSIKHLQDRMEDSDGSDEKPDKSKLVGAAAHAMILEPQRFDENFAVYRDGRRGTNDYKEFAAEHEGKRILKPNDYDEARRMADAVLSDRNCHRELWRARLREKSVFACLEGVQTKNRLDACNGAGTVIVDIKSTRAIQEYGKDMFGTQAVRLRYGMKLACYQAALGSVKETEPEVILIVVENHRPYDCVPIQVPQPWLDDNWLLAQRTLQKARRFLKGRRKKPLGIIGTERYYPLHIPQWALTDEEATGWEDAE